MIRKAWFHCFSGIAGDMAFGALVDTGADHKEIVSMLNKLELPDWKINFEKVLRCGQSGTKVNVITNETKTHRTASEITDLIKKAELPERVTKRALDTFEILAVAEGQLHDMYPADVHFHEVGAIDSIIDIVGTCAALEILSVDEVWSSPVTTGIGTTQAAHGEIPIPAPATVKLLQGAPVQGSNIPFELTTPTGAALLAAMTVGWGQMPSMKIETTGFGAGERDLDGQPNLTQVVIGETVETTKPGQPVSLLEVNVDDATGETLAHAIACCLEEGAHDAWITPIVMKKGRPAHTVSVLCSEEQIEKISKVLTSETGSLGVRSQTLHRWPAARDFQTVEIEGHIIGVKVTSGRAKIEHDDAVRAAQALGVPLREILSRAEEAWRHE